MAAVELNCGRTIRPQLLVVAKIDSDDVMKTRRGVIERPRVDSLPTGIRLHPHAGLRTVVVDLLGYDRIVEACSNWSGRPSTRSACQGYPRPRVVDGMQSIYRSNPLSPNRGASFAESWRDGWPWKGPISSPRPGQLHPAKRQVYFDTSDLHEKTISAPYVFAGLIRRARATPLGLHEVASGLTPHPVHIGIQYTGFERVGDLFEAY